MTRGGFNRAGLEAATAAFAAPAYGALQMAGGATRALRGDVPGGVVQAAGGAVAGGILGHGASAVAGRRGNPLAVRGGPPVSSPAQQVEANVRSRAVRAQGRAGRAENMVTPRQLQNRPGTPSPEQVEAGWRQQERALATAKAARDSRAVARYKERAAAARREEAKISAAAARDAARINAREAERLAKAKRSDWMEQARAITAGRKAAPRKVRRTSSPARAKSRANIIGVR